MVSGTVRTTALFLLAVFLGTPAIAATCEFACLLPGSSRRVAGPAAVPVSSPEAAHHHHVSAVAPDVVERGSARRPDLGGAARGAAGDSLRVRLIALSTDCHATAILMTPAPLTSNAGVGPVLASVVSAAETCARPASAVMTQRPLSSARCVPPQRSTVLRI